MNTAKTAVTWNNIFAIFAFHSKQEDSEEYSGLWTAAIICRVILIKDESRVTWILKISYFTPLNFLSIEGKGV